MLRHLLLELQAPREHIHEARNLGQPDHLAIGQIGDMRAAEEGQQMMFAQAVELDVAHEDDALVFCGKERAIDEPVHVHFIPGQQLAVRSRDALGVRSSPGRAKSWSSAVRRSRIANAAGPPRASAGASINTVSFSRRAGSTSTRPIVTSLRYGIRFDT